MHATDRLEAEERDQAEEVRSLSTKRILQAAASGENLAGELGPQRLLEIGGEVVEGYEKDLQSRSGWEARMDKAMELAMQVVQTKTHPWPGASNVKLPLLTIASQQFASRAFPTLVRDPEPVKGKVNGQPTQEKLNKAVRIGQHMSYQLMEGIDGWVEGMDVLLHVLPIMGCDFKKTYKDEEGIKSERVSAKDLVFDYYAKDVESARRKTHVLELHSQEIIEKQRLGVYLEPENGLGEASALSLDKNDVRDKVGGTEEPQDPKVTPHLTLEQHTFFDLDDDGYEEPYVVTVQKETKHVFSIVPRFQLDGVTGDGERIAKIVPDEYFTQWVFFPDPTGGNLGLGWGHILFPMNEAINTLVNQLIDAGTLSNLQGGFISSSLAKDWKSGTKKLAMNEWHKVNAQFEDLSKGLVPFPFKGPSAVLFNLLGLLVEWAQRLTSVTDAMAGDNPPTNQPATTTLAMLEQGQKVFQGIYKRLYRAFSRELKKIKRLNSLYLTDAEYYTVLDLTPKEVAAAMGLPEGYGGVFPTDYQTDDTDVSPSADPSVGSEQQALQRAVILKDALVQGLPFNPQQIAQLLVDALQIPKASQQGLIPEPQTQEDPRIQMERERIQGELELKGAELQLKQEAKAAELDLKREEKSLDLQLKQEEFRHDRMMKEDEHAFQQERSAAEFEHQREVDFANVETQRQSAHMKAAQSRVQKKAKNDPK
jgi:chaperonin GroES